MIWLFVETSGAPSARPPGRAARSWRVLQAFAISGRRRCRRPARPADSERRAHLPSGAAPGRAAADAVPLVVRRHGCGVFRAGAALRPARRSPRPSSAVSGRPRVRRSHLSPAVAALETVGPCRPGLVTAPRRLLCGDRRRALRARQHRAAAVAVDDRSRGGEHGGRTGAAVRGLAVWRALDLVGLPVARSSRFPWADGRPWRCRRLSAGVSRPWPAGQEAG